MKYLQILVNLEIYKESCPMKNLLLFGVSFLILLCLSCKKDDNNSGNSDPGSDGQEYAGQATTIIKYYEYNTVTGQDDFIEEKTYNYEIFIYMQPPLSLDGVTESNPNNFQLYPNRDNGNEEGHIDLSSCLIVEDELVGQVLLQYWNININGSVITGNLYDNHLAESAAANMLWAWDDVAGIIMVVPFYVANGSALTGTINDNSISLLISGESTDSYRKFSTSISGSLKNKAH